MTKAGRRMFRSFYNTILLYRHTPLTVSWDPCIFICEIWKGSCNRKTCPRIISCRSDSDPRDRDMLQGLFMAGIAGIGQLIFTPSPVRSMLVENGLNPEVTGLLTLWVGLPLVWFLREGLCSPKKSTYFQVSPVFTSVCQSTAFGMQAGGRKPGAEISLARCMQLGAEAEAHDGDQGSACTPTLLRVITWTQGPFSAAAGHTVPWESVWVWSFQVFLT